MEFHFLLVSAVLLMSLAHSQAAERLVDLTGPGCDEIDGFYIEEADDILTLYHIPQYNVWQTRDRCDVTVRTLPTRRIEYYIEVINFNECGVEIFLYDNPTIDSNPIETITCNDNHKVPIKNKSRFHVLRLKIRRTESNAVRFEFRMKMKNDLGPPMEFEIDDSNYTGEALEPGIIAGIAIAGVIIIIALILLAIYLCIRARQANMKDMDRTEGASSVYTSGTSQVIFPTGSTRKTKYGSMEDVRSTTSSQEKTNGAYSNSAYTKGPGEKRSERQASIGRSRGKAAFANEAYEEDGYGGRSELSWEGETSEVNRGSQRRSRKDTHDTDKKQLKSAMKKSTDYEMSKVNTQPINGILKTKTRSHSPNRSQTSSTEGSLDTNTMMYGYKHAGKDHPNIQHKPVIERRRSRSRGTASHRSGSSHGSTRGRRARSLDKEKEKAKAGGRMYTDVFFDDRSHRSRRSRSNSLRSKRSDRTSDSVDRNSESSASSSAYSSKKVSMNPGGKRVHIKGEETDI